MELRHLRYFLAVASHQSFTRAAEALHVSQPSLSVQIAALEDELGAPLFDRLGRKVALTQAGEILHAHAERLLREVDHATEAIHELTNGARGRLQVGALSTVNSYLIPPLVSRFRRRFPGVHLQIHALPSADIVSAVLASRLDLGLCLLPVPQEHVVVSRLFQERLVLVAPAQVRLLRNRMRMRELAQLPLVLMPADYCLRKMIEAECAAAGVRPQVSVEMTSPDGILEAIRHGAGFTILPELYVRPRLQEAALRAIPLYDPVPRHPVGLIHLAGRHLGLAAREFLRLCRTVLAELQLEPEGSGDTLPAGPAVVAQSR
ncbi:LysR family transcriptional regulator [Nitrospira sp. Kam-Ns4a]